MPPLLCYSHPENKLGTIFLKGMTVENHIGDKIKQLRMKAGLTQIELASKIGTDQPLLTRWENGKKHPSLPNLIKIAEIFNISLDTLAFSNRDLQALQAHDKTLANKLRDFDKLTEQDKETVANLISSLAQKKK